MTTNTRPCRQGFTLVEIMVVVAIVGLLAAIVLPNFLHAQTVSQANACINNLAKIDAAATEFALESHKKTGDAIVFPADLTPFIKLDNTGHIPACPAGGVYGDTKVGTLPTCSLGSSVAPVHIMP